MHTTPVKRPTLGLCQMEQLWVEVEVCVGFPGRRNVSLSLRLKQSRLLLLGRRSVELLFLRQVWRFMITR